jgi:hypothetical protein
VTLWESRSLPGVFDRPDTDIVSGLFFVPAASLAAAVGCLLALVDLCRGVEQVWTGTLQQRGTDVLVVERRAINVVAATLDAGLAGSIRRIRGVSAELVEAQPAT